MPTFQEQMAADNAAILSTGEFAEQIAISLGGGPATVIDAIVDTDVIVETQYGEEVATHKLQAVYQTSAYPAITSKHRVQVRGNAYKTYGEPVADTGGLTRIFLTKA